MEEGILKAIKAIEAATGKKPKRIELDGGLYMMKFHGVEILMTASQCGYFFIKNCATPADEEQK